MNKIIINKRIYDLDTATVLIDFINFSLYKSKNNNFFTLENGNYYEIDREKAFTLCSYHLSVDEVSKIFVLEEG